MMLNVHCLFPSYAGRSLHVKSDADADTRNLSAHIQYVYNNHHNSIGNRTAVVGGGPIDLDGES